MKWMVKPSSARPGIRVLPVEFGHLMRRPNSEFLKFLFTEICGVAIRELFAPVAPAHNGTSARMLCKSKPDKALITLTAMQMARIALRFR
jgi:hypothetical protein